MKAKLQFLVVFMLGLSACSEKQQQANNPNQTDKTTVTNSNSTQIKNEQVLKPNHTHASSHAVALKTSHYFVYDITQFLPHSKEGQNTVLHEMYRMRQNISQFQECMQHNSFAQTTYAIHLQSIGNYAEARKYYLLAASKGNAYAENRLGEMYVLGLGVKPNLTEAKFWFERAAATGYAFSESALGAIYLDFPFNSINTVYHPVDGLWFSPEKIINAKIGKKADIAKATYWLTRAAKQNDEYSVKMMEHFNLSIDETPIQETRTDVVIEQPNCRAFNRAENYAGKLTVLGQNRPLKYDTPLFKRFGHIQIGYLYLNNEGRINSISSNKWGDWRIYLGNTVVPRKENNLEVKGKILPPNAGEK